MICKFSRLPSEFSSFQRDFLSFNFKPDSEFPVTF